MKKILLLPIKGKSGLCSSKYIQIPRTNPRSEIQISSNYSIPQGPISNEIWKGFNLIKM